MQSDRIQGSPLSTVGKAGRYYAAGIDLSQYHDG